MTPRPPTIVALGGGGFLMEPENPLLDEHILAVSGADAPRVCFLPTAGGDAPERIEAFHDAYAALGARTSELRLPWRSAPDGPPEAGAVDGPPGVADPSAHLASQDVILVGGGNTRRMLAVWRAFGLVEPLRAIWANGKAVLAGVSAGALCWFEEGVTDSLPGELTPMRGLGFLPGSHCPHYDGEAARRPAYERLVGDGTLLPGMAADDGCALVYRDHDLVDVVSSRPEAAAWRVDRVAGGAVSRRTDARYLG